MTTFAYESLRPVLSQPREQLCENVLALCEPYLPEAPACGWLRWVYDYLVLGLYPDPTAVVDPNLAAAADLYVSALEWAMAREMADFDPMTDLLEIPEQKSRVFATSTNSLRTANTARKPILASTSMTSPSLCIP